MPAGLAIERARVRIPFATVSKLGHFRTLHWHPCWLSCINEYLAIDSGGNFTWLFLARNCCLTRILPPREKLSWCRNEQVCQGGGGKKCKALWAVQRTGYCAIYKNYLYLFYHRFDEIESEGSRRGHGTHAYVPGQSLWVQRQLARTITRESRSSEL